MKHESVSTCGNADYARFDSLSTKYGTVSLCGVARASLRHVIGYS